MIDDYAKSSVEMHEWMCANCGIVQWMPKDFDEKLRNSHQVFYCVNGHQNVYKQKTKVEDLQDKLANKYSVNSQLESLVNKLRSENEELKKSFVNRIFK